MNRIDLDEIYEMDAPRATKKPLEFVCNQIVHSYIFTPGFNEEGSLKVLFFASDHQKDSGMFGINIDEIVSIFEEIGNNDPSYFHISRGRSDKRQIIKVTD